MEKIYNELKKNARKISKKEDFMLFAAVFRGLSQEQSYSPVLTPSQRSASARSVKNSI
jgi:hypothetical protein